MRWRACVRTGVEWWPAGKWRWGRGAIVALACGLLWSCASARAQPDALQLTWQAPAGCPSEAQVLAEVRRVLGPRAVFAAPLSALARVERRGGRHVLELTTTYQGEHGHRTLEARDCAALMQSVTLVLGLLIDTDEPAAVDGAADGAVDGADEASSVPAADVPPARGGAGVAGPEATQAAGTRDSERGRAPGGAVLPSAPVPARADAATDASREDGSASEATSAGAVLGGARAEGRSDYGPPEQAPPDSRELDPGSRRVSLMLDANVAPAWLAETAYGLGVGVDLGLGPFALLVQAQRWLPRVEGVSPGVHAELGAVGASALGCRRLAADFARLGLCAGARVAAIQGASGGPESEPGRSVAPFFALLAGADGSFPRDARLRLRLAAEAGVSLGRPRFEVRGLGTVHRVPLVSYQLALGMVWSP